MDLDRWQATSVVQKALDIFVHALSLQRHNDATHDVIFLLNSPLFLLLSFESMLRYEPHESWAHDLRVQSGWHADYNKQCLHFLTCLQSLPSMLFWVSIVGLAHNGSWSLTGSKCSPESTGYLCTCFITTTSQWCYSWCYLSSKFTAIPAAMIRDARAFNHHYLTRLQWLARIFVWASVFGLAQNGCWSLTGSKCSPDSFRVLLYRPYH